MRLHFGHSLGRLILGVVWVLCGGIIVGTVTQAAGERILKAGRAVVIAARGRRLWEAREGITIDLEVIGSAFGYIESAPVSGCAGDNGAVGGENGDIQVPMAKPANFPAVIDIESRSGLGGRAFEFFAARHPALTGGSPAPKRLSPSANPTGMLEAGRA